MCFVILITLLLFWGIKNIVKGNKVDHLRKGIKEHTTMR